MNTITFKQDYRGILSAERFFPKGAVVDLDAEVNEGIDGKALVSDGRAKKGGTVPEAKSDKPKAKKGADKKVAKED